MSYTQWAEDSVQISKKEYEELKRRDKILSALEAGGVDNWDYYFDSLQDAGLTDDE